MSEVEAMAGKKVHPKLGWTMPDAPPALCSCGRALKVPVARNVSGGWLLLWTCDKLHAETVSDRFIEWPFPGGATGNELEAIGFTVTFD